MSVERLKEIKKELIKVRSMCENTGFETIIESSAFELYVKEPLKLVSKELTLLIKHKEG